VTGGKEGASALAALQLLNPSPYNLITVYPLLQHFQTDVLRSVLVRPASTRCVFAATLIIALWHAQELSEIQDIGSSSSTNSRLLDYVDEFVEQVGFAHVHVDCSPFQIKF
jgi:hypothetical protein